MNANAKDFPIYFTPSNYSTKTIEKSGDYYGNGALITILDHRGLSNASPDQL